MAVVTAASTLRDSALTALIEAQWHEHELVLSLPDEMHAAVTSGSVDELLESAPLPDDFHEWSGHTAETVRLYAMPSNQARLGWLLNAVDEGERIVDIGPGSGSIGGRILCAKRPQRYAAIEPSDGKVVAFRGMAAENGVPASSYELHPATAEQSAATVIADVQPTLILLLEVLEHVSDPGSLIALTAEAMPHDCDLLISVPILGRIEHEWGHRSVFDRPRLEELTASAGLVTHWVQPIADLWLFLLLSKSPSPRPRLARLSPGRAASARDAAADEADYFFRPVAVERTTIRAAARKSTTTTIEPGEFSVLRLRATADLTALPKAVTVEFTTRGRPVERWAVGADEIARAGGGPATWVFRRGTSHSRRHRDLSPRERPDGCTVTVKANLRHPATVELQRAEVVAWVGDPVVPIVSRPPVAAWSLRRLVGKELRRARRFASSLR